MARSAPRERLKSGLGDKITFMEFDIERELAGIKNDRDRGASQLAEDGVRLMARALEKLAGHGSAEALESARGIAARLRKARPSMAPIGFWSASFYAELKRRLGQQSAGALERAMVDDVVSGVLECKKMMAEGVVKAAAAALKDTGSIFTLSYSATVERILVDSACEGVEVIVAESRPLNEGRSLASALLSVGRRVTLITDTQAGLFVGKSDVVLFGADTICSDLAVVNKVGSYPVSLLARESGVDVIVAADTSKINPAVSSQTVELEEKPGGEVWEDNPRICRNIYFETVPWRLISGCVTENGFLTKDEMEKEVQKVKRLFEDVAGQPFFKERT